MKRYDALGGRVAASDDDARFSAALMSRYGTLRERVPAKVVIGCS